MPAGSRSRLPAALAAMAVVAASLSVTATPATAGSPAARAAPSTVPSHQQLSLGAVDGAAGIGDLYFPAAGNGGYHVVHYDLALSYAPPDPAPAPLVGRLTGTASILLVPTDDLDRFNLDLRDLTVSTVLVAGRAARFALQGGELTITPARALREGRPVTVVVTYGGPTGRPTDIENALYGWVTTRDGAMVASEPEGASTWFPVNDHPTDKATYDLRLTVPRGLVAVSNGELAGVRSRGRTSTWHWTSREPMAPYLVTATIGNFDLRTSLGPAGIQIIDAVDDDLDPAASADLDRTADMLEFFTTVFGPYPFSTAGNIVDDDDLGYALETQTRPLYSGAADEATIAHEQAHQWVGNSVSPRRWSDIWLNEGWATFAEWLWTEHDGGPTSAERFGEVMATPPTSAFWRRIVDDPGPTGLFSAAVYDRGAATLYALRATMGDRRFAVLAKLWPTLYRGRTAGTGEFERLASFVAHRDLTSFFDTWLRTPERPQS